jgi:hypothetical protein
MSHLIQSGISSILLAFLSIGFSSSALKAQSGWKTVKDRTGSCQISVPPNWTPLSTPGMVNSPQSRTTMVASGHRPYRPFSKETLTVLGVEKTFENSATRALYVGKPSGTPPFVNFHVEVPGKTNSCIAQITMPLGSDEDAKKIALTLTRTP